tara:strand:- start:2205 stop:2402 length:198 start_codon:yes stop_codon:yes gene_type:complete
MSQKSEIAKLLKRGRRITPIQALDKFGCFRLAARIDDLRRDGLDIETTMIYKNGKRHANYGLARG